MTKKKNPFNTFNVPMSLNIDIKTLDFKYKTLLSEGVVSSDVAMDISNYYKALRNDFSRGEEILKIYEIDQDSVQLPDGFLEKIIDGMDVNELQNLSDEIYEEIKDIIVTKEVSKDFSIKFMMYKYINKSFLGN